MWLSLDEYKDSGEEEGLGKELGSQSDVLMGHSNNGERSLSLHPGLGVCPSLKYNIVTMHSGQLQPGEG